MKWIKSRKQFLIEAKIGDELLPSQKQLVKNTWGESILELEKIEATDNIIQGEWKLTEEEKNEALSKFFNADLKEVYEFFEGLPNEFKECLDKSIDKNNDKYKDILKNFDIHKPTIAQISILSEKIFKKISVGESKADEIIDKDETGKPKLDKETGKPLKRKREKDEIIFTKNLVNINTLTDDYNKLYPDKTVDDFKFASGDVLKVISASKEDYGGDNYIIDMNVYAGDLYLLIDHNPTDILNMSVSRFYGSCQHLYRGGFREQLIGNVFDPNSVPAFLYFKSELSKGDGWKLSDKLFLSRMMIRNIDTPEEDKNKFKLYFDRCYPDRMKNLMDDIVTKYTKMEPSFAWGDGEYIFAPDIPEDVKIKTPYMDNLRIAQKRLIGINSKSITFAPNSDWSNVKISPKANLEEINIETNKLPDNFFELKLKPKTIQFRYMKLTSLEEFKNLKSDAFSFENCKFSNEILEGLNKNVPDIKCLKFKACELDGKDLTIFKNLEELHLLFSDFKDLKEIVDELNIKKLVLSTDLSVGKANKEYIETLKSKKIKVEFVGPKIGKKK